MRYRSTRSVPAAVPVSFSRTVFSGLAPDGGLYLPESWPDLSADIGTFQGQPYAEVAARVLEPLVTGAELAIAELEDLCRATYHPDVFRHPDIAPLRQISDDFYLLELFHGPTLAFKDYALQLLGRLFDHFLARDTRTITILGATSGDTGSAAIEACKRIRGARVFILHPAGRTSEIQRRQMTTVRAPHVFNLAVDGTFDDCQTIVKTLFADKKFADDLHLTAINSINWARVAAQTVYYMTAAQALGAPDVPVSFSVPTGNFGNVFSGYAARHMGLPIQDLVIGTNRNDALTRFFQSGALSPARVVPTLSPSMDIQIPSNFERYLYDLLRRDGSRLAGLMATLKKDGTLSLNVEDQDRARHEFSAHRCSDTQTLETMADVYKTSGVLIDPHTAVGVFAARQHRARTPGRGPMVALACAHPAKFPETVEKATGVRPPLPEFLADLMTRSERFTPVRNDPDIIRRYILSNAPS